MQNNQCNLITTDICISIIIPVYNVEKYIGECLESVIGQSLKNIEIICINDGSTDHSLAILNEYATRDERIKIIDYKQNKGPAFARNCGIKNAEGGYIIFVDADDMIAENSLLALYEKIESAKADGVTFDLESLYEDGVDHTDIIKFEPHKSDYPEVYTGQTLFTLQRQNDDLQVMTCLYMWKRKFLMENNLLFHEGIIHEDDPFTICALIHTKRMIYLKKVCYLYRRRKNSITTKSHSCEHLIGRIEGQTDILRSLAKHNDTIETDFRKSLTDLILARRHYNRIRLIRLIRNDEQDLKLYAENFESYMEWQSIMRADYYDISGVMDAHTYKKLLKYNTIIVYGIGRVGMEVVKLLEEYEIRNYVTAVTKKDQSILGLNLHSEEIADLAENFKDVLVLLAVGKNLQGILMKTAVNLGFRDVVKATEFFSDEINVELVEDD